MRWTRYWNGVKEMPSAAQHVGLEPRLAVEGDESDVTEPFADTSFSTMPTRVFRDVADPGEEEREEKEPGHRAECGQEWIRGQPRDHGSPPCRTTTHVVQRIDTRVGGEGRAGIARRRVSLARASRT
jgi:hypothetical protein